MASRTRTKSTMFPSGGVAHYWVAAPFNTYFTNTTQNNSGKYSQLSVCQDAIGSPKSDNPLDIQKKVWRMEPLNGRGFGGVAVDSENPTHTHYINWYPNAFTGDIAHLAVSLPETITSAATRLLALTSPSRYDVQNVQNIVDFKDLPKLVRLAGKTIPKMLAGANLSWRFGWAPLISDFKKMLDFQGRVNKRAKEMRQLHRKGGMRRRRDLGNASAEEAQVVISESVLGELWFARVAKFTTVRRWGTVRWYPTHPPPVDDSDYRKTAWTAVSGLDISASSVWEALPWTWLADWFGDIGDYLTLYNNLVPAQPSTPCIMEKTETHVVVTPTNHPSWLTGGHGTGYRVSKTRNLAGAGVSLNFPFISEGQLSILASLAILRRR